MNRQPPEIVADPKLARSLMVTNFGPRCAGWMIRDLDRRRKKKGKRFDGTFSVHIADGVEMPMWFSLAVDYLKTRSRWVVITRSVRGAREFVFSWHARGAPAPIPLSLVPVDHGRGQA